MYVCVCVCVCVCTMSYIHICVCVQCAACGREGGVPLRFKAMLLSASRAVWNNVKGRERERVKLSALPCTGSRYSRPLTHLSV